MWIFGKHGWFFGGPGEVQIDFVSTVEPPTMGTVKSGQPPYDYSEVPCA